MRHRSGFTLIEVLIGILLASIMATALFALFDQVRLFIPRIDRYTDVYSKIAIANNQLERDFSGVCVPLEYTPKKDKKEEKPEVASDTKSPAATQPEPKKKERKRLEKIFYSENAGDMLSELTCITTNPLPIYWGTKSGRAIARLVRVMYRLKDVTKKGEKEKKYALVRQESEQLDYSKFKAGGDIKEYVLIEGITSCTVEYSAILEKKDIPKVAPGMVRREPIKPTFEIKKLSVWNEADVKDEKKEEPLPLFPQLATLKMSVYDSQNRLVDVVLSYAILSSPLPPTPSGLALGDSDSFSKLPDILRKLTQGAPPPPPSIRYGLRPRGIRS